MTDIIHMRQQCDRFLSVRPPMLNDMAARPALCRRDILQNALDGNSSNEPSLEQFFDWLEGNK